MQSDEARAVNFRQSIERLSGEVNMIATRVADEEKGTLQRIANLEVNGFPTERVCYVWRVLPCIISGWDYGCVLFFVKLSQKVSNAPKRQIDAVIITICAYSWHLSEVMLAVRRCAPIFRSIY